MPMYNPAHPGALLREYMGESMTISALARHLGMTRAQLSMILNGRAGISPLTSLKLDEAFAMSDGFWYRAQTQYDLAQARKKKRVRIPPILKKAA